MAVGEAKQAAGITANERAEQAAAMRYAQREASR